MGQQVIEKKQFNQKLDKFVTLGKQIKLVEKKNHHRRNRLRKIARYYEGGRKRLDLVCYPQSLTLN